MIDRYSRPEMRALWSEEAKYRRWLEVEITVCEVLAEAGLVPPRAVEKIKAKAAFDVARIDAIEREVRHDVIAFLTNVAESVGPEARWLHYGMTSSDVLESGVERVMVALHRRALEHRRTPIVGRTHGIHAEPTTFGLKLLVFHEEMRRNRDRLARALEEVSVGKISG